MRVKLENPDSAVEVEVYDELTKTRWGWIRLRRQLNPGVLALEGRPDHPGSTFRPMAHFAVLDGQLGVRHWFRGGGPSGDTAKSVSDE